MASRFTGRRAVSRTGYLRSTCTAGRGRVNARRGPEFRLDRLLGRCCSINAGVAKHSVGRRSAHRCVHEHDPSPRCLLARLREHGGIDRWVVVGVSWGVTSGLLYVQCHPERVWLWS